MIIAEFDEIDFKVNLKLYIFWFPKLILWILIPSLSYFRPNKDKMSIGEKLFTERKDKDRQTDKKL